MSENASRVDTEARLALAEQLIEAQTSTQRIMEASLAEQGGAPTAN